METISTMGTTNVFEIRGVIEGYYGKPWTFRQRCDLLDFLQAHGMNSYFYAAKYDAYHRERWAELYQPEDCRELGRLAEHALLQRIDFWYCIAPGLTLCYSDPGDMDRHMAKTEQVYRLGVRHVGLFLDDIPPQLQHTRDTQRYASLAEAHIDFIARYAALLKEKLPEPVQLCVCPWQYCGTGEEAYITALGRSLPPEIKLLWTGPQVCSKTLETEQTERFLKATGHRPLYWDNYPVNDAGMYREMHLGPLLGRDATLGGYSDGYLSNGMEYYECTKIVLYTVADYLCDPAHYNPEVSLRAALESELKDAGASLLLLVDNTRHSCLQEANSRILHSVLFEMRKALVKGCREEAADLLAAYVLRLDTLEGDIALGRIPEKLLGELEPWLRRHRGMHRVLHLTVQYLRNPSPSLSRWIRDELDAMKAMTVDYGDCDMELAVGEILRNVAFAHV
ncbi:MAG: protein O-GlcNAcase [Eubacteriales bacterium]|nr:protein O-GlcNAcase [Eubacteriales bacterium]